MGGRECGLVYISVEGKKGKGFAPLLSGTSFAVDFRKDLSIKMGVEEVGVVCILCAYVCKWTVMETKKKKRIETCFRTVVLIFRWKKKCNDFAYSLKILVQSHRIT